MSAPAWVDMCRPSAISAIEPEHGPAADLGRHHRPAEADDQPGPPLVALVRGAEEDVLVAELVDGLGVHAKASFAGRMARGRAG